jgi:hypothetical protein
MKKRILFISLALVLVLTVLMPGAALAKVEKHRPPTPAIVNFTGSGIIYVTYMPDPFIKGHIWCYRGEIAEGFLAQSDWDLLAGAAFWSSHDSIVRVDKMGNANGIMKGTFTLSQPDGVLEGTFSGRIRGNLFTYTIMDEGVWMGTGGTGVFQGVKAWGTWSADLILGCIPGTSIYTLIGPLDWAGKYMTR